MATTVLTSSEFDRAHRAGPKPDRGLVSCVRAADRRLEDSSAALRRPRPRPTSDRRPIVFDDLFEGSSVPACLRDD